MGLDIVMYGRDNTILGVTEIEYALHEALFLENNNWRSYLYLRKLSDYYLTDIIYDRVELDKLINDLKNIILFIPKQRQYTLEKLASLLNDRSIEKVHIAGD